MIHDGESHSPFYNLKLLLNIQCYLLFAILKRYNTELNQWFVAIGYGKAENRTMKRCLIFLFITFALSWSAWIMMDLSGLYGTMQYMLISALLMFTPLIAAALTKLLMKGKAIEYSWKPRLGGNIRIYISAWLLPVLFSLLGSLAFFAIFPFS